MSKKVRLQKYLASCGACSRRTAEDLISESRVQVNGVIVNVPGVQVDPANDIVLLDSKPVKPQPKHLYLFHKPIGMVTTMNDPQGRCCLGEIAERFPVRVFPVGRLDADVSGLLLLTNDGEFADNLLHPRNEVPRTYWAVVNGVFSPKLQRRICSGVVLDDGVGCAFSAEELRLTKNLEQHFNGIPAGCTVVKLSVGEGRKHFVKRLFAAVGCPVQKLSRVAFGKYQLGDLSSGEHCQAKIGAVLPSP